MKRLLAILLFVAAEVRAGSFDLRDLGVVTPIRSQVITTPSSGTMDSGECSGFSICAALETDYMLSTGGTVGYLSPQYVDDISSGTTSLLYAAMVAVTRQGTVLDSLDPVTGHHGTLPTLTKPYTLYRPSSFVSLPNDTAALKTFLAQHGPIITEVDNATFCWQWNEWEWDASIWGNHPVVDVAWGTNPDVQSGITSQSWHAIDLIGYHDDASWPGGGYWVCKSSYPANIGFPDGPWVPAADGYGEISYAALADENTIVATDLGSGRAFYGLGPAGSLTYNSDNTVAVLGTFVANFADIPDGSGLLVGEHASGLAPVAVPEPNGLLLAMLAIAMGKRL